MKRSKKEEIFNEIFNGNDVKSSPFYDVSSYDELMLQIALSGFNDKEHIEMIIKNVSYVSDAIIGKTCKAVYYIPSEVDGLIWFDVHGNRIAVPKEVDVMNFYNERSLYSCRGFPKNVHYLEIQSCNNFKSLIGFPQKIVKADIYDCNSILHIDCLPNKIAKIGYMQLYKCNSLKDITAKNCDPKVIEKVKIHRCDMFKC